MKIEFQYLFFSFFCISLQELGQCYYERHIWLILQVNHLKMILPYLEVAVQQLVSFSFLNDLNQGIHFSFIIQKLIISWLLLSVFHQNFHLSIKENLDCLEALHRITCDDPIPKYFVRLLHLIDFRNLYQKYPDSYFGLERFLRVQYFLFFFGDQLDFFVILLFRSMYPNNHPFLYFVLCLS